MLQAGGAGGLERRTALQAALQQAQARRGGLHASATGRPAWPAHASRALYCNASALASASVRWPQGLLLLLLLQAALSQTPRGTQGSAVDGCRLAGYALLGGMQHAHSAHS